MTRGFFAERVGYHTVPDLKLKLVLLLGVITAAFGLAVLGAVFTGQNVAEGKSTAALPVEAKGSTISILVPRRVVERGEPASPDLFTTISTETTSMLRGAITDFEELKGQYIKETLLQGRPIYREMLTATSVKNPVSGQLPKGFRAITIRVDKLTSVEGWITPGASVDVLWFTKAHGKEELNSLVNNVEVLSVEQSTDSKSGTVSNNPTTVTLSVQSKDAARIAYASQTGALSLVLRNPYDPTSPYDGKVTGENVNGVEPTKSSEHFVEASITLAGKRYCYTSLNRLIEDSTAGKIPCKDQELR